jgi:predicted adenine nucleotide alpha hydrolase (AANH) superfamily ATPase
MKKVLLHVCCGVCALYAIEKLKEEGYLVEGLFFNPNIYPADEYERRKDTARQAAKIQGINMTEVDYEPLLWLEVCGGYKNEKEGGARCLLCYQLRIGKTFEIAREKGFDLFTTTLTISPHKDSTVISEIGKSIGSDLFLVIDFKKKEGFKRTMELAKQYNLYRQKYCGCIYSYENKR